MGEFRQALLPVLCIVLVLTPAFRAARPLPTELSDVEFWQLINDSSEEGGGFLSENLVSNELGYPYVIPSLLERVQPGGAYMGVGPEQNFTYMAAVHPSVAFIVDIRRQNMIEHLLYKAIFELSPNRQEFISRLFARKIGAEQGRTATAEELFAGLAGVPQDDSFYRASLESVITLLVTKHGFKLGEEDKATLEHVYEEFAKHGAETRYAVTNLSFVNPAAVINLPTTREVQIIPVPAPAVPTTLSPALINLAISTQFPTYADVIKATDDTGRSWSYLASEENYQFVRKMQQKNLIVPIVGDFAGPKAIRAVGQFLKDHDASVSTFYVSNVEQYLSPFPRLHSFYTNVATLPLNPSSTFIRSAQITGPQPGLAQSSVAPVQLALDAVLEGRAQSWRDILRLPNPK